MYKNLLAEMTRNDYSVAKLAKEIGVTEKTLRNKLNGTTSFSWGEVLAIRKIVAPKIKLEELFADYKKAG